MGHGRAEEGDDGVTDDLVDHAAEGHHVGDQALEAAVHQVLDRLRVAALGQRRVAHQVGEQDGDHPTLIHPALER